MTIDFRYKTAMFQDVEGKLEFNIGVTSELKHVKFYSHIPYDGLQHGRSEEDILLYIDVIDDKKTKTLTLTVTGGSLEQYIGNVYVLSFYPGEELNLDAATTQETVETK